MGALSQMLMKLCFCLYWMIFFFFNSNHCLGQKVAPKQGIIYDRSASIPDFQLGFSPCLILFCLFTIGDYNQISWTINVVNSEWCHFLKSWILILEPNIELIALHRNLYWYFVSCWFHSSKELSWINDFCCSWDNWGHIGSE